jgi:hypothetical protein
MSNIKENLKDKHESNATPIEAEKTMLVWHSPMMQPFHIAGFSWLEQEGAYRRWFRCKYELAC